MLKPPVTLCDQFESPIFSKVCRWLHVMIVPTIGVAILNLSTLIISIGLIVALHYHYQSSPIDNIKTMDIDPADHIVDRSKGGTLTIVREIEMNRPATLQVTRVWIDDAGAITSTLDDYISVTEGRHVRSRVRIVPPTMLAAGKHRYRVGLRWCNPMKCETVNLEDIEVIILGDPVFTLDKTFQDHRF